MQSNIDQYKFGFYPTNNKNRSNYLKYHEPTKLYPSNSGKININLNSYRHNTNLSNNHHYMKKKKENSNNFNINHITKKNIINSHSKPEKVNLVQMLNNLKREIVEISNNIKQTDSKVEYYMNKNLENSKIRSNSANISKNIIILPRQKYPLSNRGISLDVINSNYSKSSNYIRNENEREMPTTDYISSINTNANTNSNNARLTYNLYSKKNNNNINRLTIQVNNNNPLHKIGCLNNNYGKKKLYNNYINEIRPKYHTAENFYRRNKRKRQKEKDKDNSKNSNTNYSINNECDNNANNLVNNISNKISEKSSIYINTNYQDYINDSIKKIPKSSSNNKNNIIDKNSKIIKNDIKNKMGKYNYKRGSLEKHILDLQDNITSSNNIMPGLFSSANDMKKELETLKNENDELKLKYDLMNNDIKKDKRLLQIENRNKDEKIFNLNKEIQRLNNTINIKDSIINILKYGNNNNYKIKSNNDNCINNNDNSSMHDLYGINNNINNIINGNNNINNSNNNMNNIILNNNIKNLQNEISKIRYNLNLQRSDDYLNLQNRNKELIQENLSLKEEIKNLIDKYYNKKQTKLENEIIIKDKKIES